MGALSRMNLREYFPPFSYRSFMRHYLPASGAVSHTLFAVHIFNPTFVSRVFTVGDLAASNTILFTANIGLGFYVYYRHHLHRLNPWDRVEFSVISTTLFNFGSLLAAVLIKALLPHKTPTWARCLIGSGLSLYLLSRAHKYLHYVDERAVRKTPTPRSMRSPAIHVEKNGHSLNHHPEPVTVLANANGALNTLMTETDASSGYGTIRNGTSVPVA